MFKMSSKSLAFIVLCGLVMAVVTVESKSCNRTSKPKLVDQDCSPPPCCGQFSCEYYANDLIEEYVQQIKDDLEDRTHFDITQLTALSYMEQLVNGRTNYKVNVSYCNMNCSRRLFVDQIITQKTNQILSNSLGCGSS